MRYGLRKTTREGVAVKIITKDPSAAPSSSRIGQEVAILRHCNRMACPYLVRLHDAFETDTLVYMVLEYCPGSLSGRLAAQERGTLAEAEARRLTRQIASALQALHGEGIVHRGAPGPVAGARPLAPSLDEPEQIADHSSESARRALPPHHPHLPLTPSRVRPTSEWNRPQAREHPADGARRLRRRRRQAERLRAGEAARVLAHDDAHALAVRHARLRRARGAGAHGLYAAWEHHPTRPLDYQIRRPRSLPAESAARRSHLSCLVRIR